MRLLAGAALAAILSAPVFAELPDRFNILRVEICDSAAFKVATGIDVKYVYIPWSLLAAASLRADHKYKGCSMLNVHGMSVHIKGRPHDLIEAMERYGVEVIVVETTEGDDG